MKIITALAAASLVALSGCNGGEENVAENVDANLMVTDNLEAPVDNMDMNMDMNMDNVTDNNAVDNTTDNTTNNTTY